MRNDATRVTTTRHVMCQLGDLAPGEMLPVVIGRRRFVVIRTSEETYRTLSDLCPHEGALFSAGTSEKKWVGSAVGAHEQGCETVLVCPWHNFEFDVATGRSVCEPNRMVTPVFDTRVEGDEVVAYI
ncbi:Rieske (2Fe-2S) protein [Rhodococcus opacus]|uniref:Rieske (2Fe-2S) protein n=1 Tax=Rhodococcus opacus TaxID=37919 RepID=UPI002236B075|nr:Rieske 2Fe-2S domain-containing protein [Rhodococcus opacus]UZG60367.1 Rieske 2Fe-2S domain-containing protein [Rhodococcus opacus]